MTLTETIHSRSAPRPVGGVLLNDEQSQLNPTRVSQVFQPRSLEDLQDALRIAKRNRQAISIAGGRHAMGGQQFGSDNLHIDTTAMNRVLELDTVSGLVTVEAGIQWPDLINELHRLQPGDSQPWTIREKQTGVDQVTIGGSLAANMHGRSLTTPPFVSSIESFDLLNADGELRHCSRKENAELFSLAVGGYGLFGLVVHVTLRLVRRYKVRRRVKLIPVTDLLAHYQSGVEQGFPFGDCQYSPSLQEDALTHQGVFPCYEPVPLETPIIPDCRQLSAEEWACLYRLIRTDKPRAFAEYTSYYQSTEGQVYWSDTHQLAGNFAGHRDAVDVARGTEMITEVYLSHENVMSFLAAIRKDLVKRETDITYGTIRFIEPDTDTFLPWARERAVCVVCNLHVRANSTGRAKVKADFRQIIDRAIEYHGSFYLTYHRWATAHQVEVCHPAIREFFRLKKKYDPGETFQSNWYRHYAPQFV